MRPFVDRIEAGRLLGERLSDILGERDVVVVGLARGGVPVAREVAATLQSPWDVMVVRKLGVPGQRELAMGAIGEGGVVIVEDQTRRVFAISDDVFNAAVAHERLELERRVRLYRGDRSLVDLEDQRVIIVDDGLATGATASAACEVAGVCRARHAVVAAPVSSDAAVRRLERAGVTVVTLTCVEGPFAVGQWYDDFTQVTDQEVTEIVTSMSRHGDERPASSPDG